MSKKLFILMTATLLFASAFAQGIKVYDTGRKWDASFDQLAAGQTVSRVAAKGEQTVTPGSMVSASVTVTDASSVAEYVKGEGYEADVITESTVVVSVPASFIPALGGRDDVLYINESRQFKPLMNRVRSENGVKKVQDGTGLETPFTGKGVVVGVIDQGFEYGHPAFTDRVVRWGNGSSSGLLRKTMPTKDKNDEVGHATHVCNIAAGSPVSGSDYYGIATGADIIQISSDFNTTSLEKQAKAIKDYAEGNGQPWVINMSLGGVNGPHDGTTDYDQTMDEMITEGGIIVAAMGNEGGMNLHAYRTIEDESSPVYLKVQTGLENTNKEIVSNVWSMANDGVEHLTITPAIIYGNKLYEPTEANLSGLSSAFRTGINSYNNRQYATFAGDLSQLLSAVGLSSSTSGAYFMWKVTGEAGSSFHAWADATQYDVSFGSNGSPYRALAGDDEYMVGEGAASIPRSIAVASYNNTSTMFTSMSGSTYNLSSDIGASGSMSKFSSKGPQIVERPKPAISAVGGAVVSAISKNSGSFSLTSYDLVQSVTVNGNKYYYSIQNGTSMACPVVTGVVALWLEANPKLSYDDIIEIFKETGRRDSKTGDADENGWNSTAGYGKIDAYNGLKKALEMANASGINETLNSSAPVSIDKRDSEWRVLFNNDESFANISLYSASGSILSSKKLAQPRRGDEQVVPFAGLNPGVYLLRVATTGSDTTRKLIVK